MRFIIAAGSSVSLSYLDESLNYLTKSKIIVHGVSKKYSNKSACTSKNYLFYNCAMAISSVLEPLVLYRELRSIEQRLGRIRSYANAPRTLDLDIIMSFPFSYSSKNFTIPHYALFVRSFFVICAIEAIQLAGWPMPFSLYQARSRLKSSILVPCISQ